MVPLETAAIKILGIKKQTGLSLDKNPVVPVGFDRQARQVKRKLPWAIELIHILITLKDEGQNREMVTWNLNKKYPARHLKNWRIPT